jgi:hypothetical protein
METNLLLGYIAAGLILWYFISNRIAARLYKKDKFRKAIEEIDIDLPGVNDDEE